MIPRLQAPVVLVHGLFGFGHVRVGGYTVATYWPGIVQALERAGNRVLVPFLSPTGGVAQRAQQLKDFLDARAPGEAVHIFAHSMGGLDARYMVSRLGMKDRVLSLTTLGTPHRGTTFADWGIRRLERLVKPVLDFLGLPAQGFYDLTTAACRAFNEAVPDTEGVRYFSIAGQYDGSLRTPEWLLPHTIVLAAEGPNDGVVSVESARWGEQLDIWEGDHFSLVNWLHPFARNRTFWRDPVPRYAAMLGRLKDEGF